MAMLGAVLSTVTDALGPAAAAALPATSVAVPDAIEMPRFPLPAIPEIVTVRVEVPDPVTATVPLAVPVAFSVMPPVANVIALTPLPPVSV